MLDFTANMEVMAKWNSKPSMGLIFQMVPTGSLYLEVD